jgi:hypothetical protein
MPAPTWWHHPSRALPAIGHVLRLGHIQLPGMLVALWRIEKPPVMKRRI